MKVAVSGDRGYTLSRELSEGIYLFAVTKALGGVSGEAVGRAVLTRLEDDFERRSRNGRLRRLSMRPKNVTAAFVAAISKINDDLYGRYGVNEDSICVACSLTAVLLVDDRAYIAHIGSTAAYLARDGYVVSLTKSDAFEPDGVVPVLLRALGLSGVTEVGICSLTLANGDALVLSSHRLRDAEQRRSLVRGQVSSQAQALTIRYNDRIEERQVQEQTEAQTVPSIVAGVLTTVLFCVLLLIK